MFLPRFAFYSPAVYNYTGALLAVTDRPPFNLLLPPGQDVCDTSTWPPLTGRVVLMSGEIGDRCPNVQQLFDNISAAGASSITYFPFRASGYFALRRFSLSARAASTPHAAMGSDEFSALVPLAAECWLFKRKDLVVTLKPEHDTHMQLYEGGGGAFFSWVFFVITWLLLAYELYVLRTARTVLRTCVTSTHVALTCNTVQLLMRSVLAGPFGWPSFSFVFASDFTESYAQSTQIFAPISTTILSFREAPRSSNA